MRRYLQGTLDFSCGIYAVINALSLTHAIGLEQARGIFQESLEAVARNPTAWPAFMRNHTDHYWLVRYMLERWCCSGPYSCRLEQPFSHCLLPRQEAIRQTEVEPDPTFFLIAQDDASQNGYSALDAAQNGVALQMLRTWFAPAPKTPPRAALMRFHRFLPGHAAPVVSHWTTVAAVQSGTLALHDASGEINSVHHIKEADTKASQGVFPLVLIVPASIVLLEKR